MAADGPVVMLAGGTGGAKLAAGLAHVLDPGELVVVANTGDDVELYGAHVSPDPDLVTFWIADRIDARGWGLDGDTFHVMDGLRELGVEVWFNLGDRDLAYGIERARRLAAGERLTDTMADLGRALEIPGARAADVRRPGPHLRARARPRMAVPGVHDRRQSRRADRRAGVPRRRAGARHARRAGGDRLAPARS